MCASTLEFHISWATRIQGCILTGVFYSFIFVGVYFSPCEYTCVESCGSCYLTVVRHGSDSLNETVEVDFETMDGSASAPGDYAETKGEL